MPGLNEVKEAVSRGALIDRFLPVFQFRERHSLVVDAHPQALLDAVLLPETMTDPWTRIFLTLRELPARVMRAVGAAHAPPDHVAFGMEHFMHLGHDPERELAFGLAGRFWQPDYGLVQIDQPVPQFADYVEPGLAKLVLNFTTESLANGQTRLTTETRVFCVDAEAMRHFKPYWLLIRPVSGLIRRRLLRRAGRLAVRRQASRLSDP